MKIAKIQCLLRVNQDGNPNILHLPKAGPDAILVTEVPILRMINDIAEGGAEDCCIARVQQVDIVDVDRMQEVERLKAKYGDARVNACYPGGRGLPETIADCELPSSAMAKQSKKEAA